MTRTKRCQRPHLGALAAVAAIALLAGCGEVRRVDLEPMTFTAVPERIPGDVEVCIDRDLRARQWNAGETGYAIELGSRASQNFERLAKASFRDALVVHGEPCGDRTDRPWLAASIVSAHRDWDGLQGFFSPEPVDTSLTLAVALHADDGTELWSTRVTGATRTTSSAREHAVDLFFNVVYVPFALFRAGELAGRGSRDFGVALAQALEQAHRELLTDPRVRAAFASEGRAPGADAADSKGGAAPARSARDA